MLLSLLGLYSWTNVTDINEKVLEMNGNDMKDYNGYYKRLKKYFEALEIRVKMRRNESAHTIRKLESDEDALIQAVEQ